MFIGLTYRGLDGRLLNRSRNDSKTATSSKAPSAWATAHEAGSLVAGRVGECLLEVLTACLHFTRRGLPIYFRAY